MVMCVGTQEYHCGHRTHHRTSSIVYFPSQDAITASVIPRGVSMWGNGTKRKLEVAQEEETQQNYFEQRQSILNISMIKLRTQPLRKVEQPLRRSVLIFNTLKHIETELQVEGVRWNLPSKPSLLPSLGPSKDDTLDALPADSTLAEHKSMASDRFGSASPRGVVAMETSACTRVASESSTVPSPVLSAASMSTVSSPDSMFSSDTRSIDSLFNMSGSQQGPLPTFSSLLDLDSSSSPSSSDSASSSSPLSFTTSSPHLPAASSSYCSSSASSSTSSLIPQHSTCRLSSAVSGTSSCASPHMCASPQTASCSNSVPQTISGHCQTVFKSLSAGSAMDHDVFSEFDFTSLDLDFPFLPNNLKLPSLSAEDLQLLPHAETFPPSLPSSCNPKHADILVDDLDSIMQILVGI